MDKIYRSVGIGLLIANIFLFLNDAFLLFASIILPETYSILVNLLGGESSALGVYIWGALETLFYLWGIIISITLIKRNKNIKQLFIWVCVLAGLRLLDFIAGLFFGEYYFVQLIIAIFIFVFLIVGKNKWAKILKEKTN
jgi:hypothetical protein